MDPVADLNRYKRIQSVGSRRIRALDLVDGQIEYHRETVDECLGDNGSRFFRRRTASKLIFEGTLRRGRISFTVVGLRSTDLESRES